MGGEAAASAGPGRCSSTALLPIEGESMKRQRSRPREDGGPAMETVPLLAGVAALVGATMVVFRLPGDPLPGRMGAVFGLVLAAAGITTLILGGPAPAAGPIEEPAEERSPGTPGGVPPRPLGCLAGLRVAAVAGVRGHQCLRPGFVRARRPLFADVALPGETGPTAERRRASAWWAQAGRRLLNTRGQGDPRFFKGMVGIVLVVAALVSFSPSPHQPLAGGMRAALLCLGGLLWWLQIREWRGPLTGNGAPTAATPARMPTSVAVLNSPGGDTMPDPTGHPAMPSLRTAVLLSGGTVVASLGDRIMVATGGAAMKGLLGRVALMPGEGLYFPNATFGALHSIGMRFSFDALYLDRRGLVRRVLHGVRPGRLCPWDLFTAAALELPAGAARDVRAGDAVEFRPG